MPFIRFVAFALKENVPAACRHQHTSYLCADTLLGCERSDDFFEAGIAAERIPPRHQLQFAVAYIAARADCSGKLFASEIFIADPRGDSSQTDDHDRPA